MPLDRMSIEKKDFPVGRRGYDPEAVDAHLRRVGEEVAELKRSTSQRTETLAGVASVRVQAIVDAAEQSAAEIRRQAEKDARAIRDEATRDAQRERDEAARDAKNEREEALQQSREYVGNVSEAAARLRTRLDAMESELGVLTDALRTGGNRLSAELEVVESGMSDLSAVAKGNAAPGQEEPVATALPGAGELEPEPTLAAAEPEPQVVPAGAPEQDEDDLPLEPKTAAELEPDPELEPESELEPEPEADSEPEPVTAEAQPAEVATDARAGSSGGENQVVTADDGDDTEGARLIALNMALNGTPREETDRYLAENFELSDRGQLLDEVYASVEG